jgi:sulfite exporter TauE/SafE
MNRIVPFAALGLTCSVVGLVSHSNGHKPIGYTLSVLGIALIFFGVYQQMKQAPGSRPAKDSSADEDNNSKA